MVHAFPIRWLLLAVWIATSAGVRAQSTPDTTHMPDHWVAVDLKEWAWYLNLTSQQKNAVHAIDERCIAQENAAAGTADYVDTEEQRDKRKAIVAAGTEEVRTVLDPARYARWRYIRDGGRPIKPTPATGIRTGIGVRIF